MLIGQGVDPLRKEEMLAFLHQQPEVQHIFNLLTLQMGSDVMVAVKARMSEADSSVAMIKDINQVESRFRDNFPEVRWLFFEPDLND